MPPKVSWGFSFFGNGGASAEKKVDVSAGNLRNSLSPTLRLQTDKDVYRPGDLVAVTIEIHNRATTTEISEIQHEADDACSLLVERLGFEIKGTEKLDIQWFTIQKPLPGSKQRRGEQVFLDCFTPSVISNQFVSSGATKTYIVRTELPKTIPPSYRGTTIRYFYYVRTTLSGRWLALENGHSHRDSMKDTVLLEARIPLQIWVTQKTSGWLNEDQSDGILPATTIPMDIYWKEKDADCEWARANETSDGVEEGYESSRDETLSVSSYNPSKGNIDVAFGSSLSLQSSASRFSNKDVLHLQGEHSSLSSYMALPHVSVAEVLYDSSGDVLSPHKVSPAVLSPSKQRKQANPLTSVDDTGVSSVAGTSEPAASEGFIRGKSYNIRLDDQVLLRFSPKNSDSTYYFSDMIGGTLTFFHEEGARRCLEVSITLETSETISQRFVHPSRRNSPTITKVQSDHYEVVADLVQTSFLFSIPMDGPMSFSTPLVSVQWALRFEFFTTPKNVDWTRVPFPVLWREVLDEILGVGHHGQCFNILSIKWIFP
ncbi:Reduced growth phenotype protein 1 [Macleaya cordata]|uniref:Reduced growth phenotype protein 1 n=1 Tax=Macleaya cordata TaxID=56857 RepID=A0A200PXU8_MACCD|nr:Reduced growth phenotype protein 1 [Macleaya cordata]